MALDHFIQQQNKTENDVVVIFAPDGCNTCIKELNKLLFDNNTREDLILFLTGHNAKMYKNKYGSKFKVVMANKNPYPIENGFIKPQIINIENYRVLKQIAFEPFTDNTELGNLIKRK